MRHADGDERHLVQREAIDFQVLECAVDLVMGGIAVQKEVERRVVVLGEPLMRKGALLQQLDLQQVGEAFRCYGVGAIKIVWVGVHDEIIPVRFPIRHFDDRCDLAVPVFVFEDRSVMGEALVPFGF